MLREVSLSYEKPWVDYVSLKVLPMCFGTGFGGSSGRVHIEVGFRKFGLPVVAYVFWFGHGALGKSMSLL